MCFSVPFQFQSSTCCRTDTGFESLQENCLPNASQHEFNHRAAEAARRDGNDKTRRRAGQIDTEENAGEHFIHQCGYCFTQHVSCVHRDGVMCCVTHPMWRDFLSCITVFVFITVSRAASAIQEDNCQSSQLNFINLRKIVLKILYDTKSIGIFFSLILLCIHWIIFL